MEVQEALAFLETRARFGVKLGLRNMRALLEFLGHPEKDLKYIHIAGTNGKGSTSMSLTVLLNQLGFKVGLYSSPFIYDFFERFRVFQPYSTKDLKENMTLGNLPAERFAKYMEKIQKFCELQENQSPEEKIEPTYFEVLTALSFLYFKEEACDYVVLEVGLGGRYDATNVIDKALCTVITALSYDHKHILGDTLSSIAFEKAGILKEDTPLVFYHPNIRFVLASQSFSEEEKQDYHQALEVVCHQAKSCSAPLVFLNPEDVIFPQNFMDLKGIRFQYKGYMLQSALLGQHQAYNAALALLTLWTLIEQESALKQAWESLGEQQEAFLNRSLSYVVWPCRMEKMQEQPLFLYDGAHNEDGSLVLKKNLDLLFKGERIDVLCGILEDKEIDKMLRNVLQNTAYQVEHIYLVKPESDRALALEELKAKILNIHSGLSVELFEDDEQILSWLKQRNANSPACVGFGSLYLGKRIKTLVERSKAEKHNV